MNVVFDSNVHISASISRHGVCAQLIRRCIGKHSIVLSEPILAEIREKLAFKIKLSAEGVSAALDFLRSETEIVLPEVLDARVCRDPKDDMVLATALAGKADCIVTGDKDLLVLESHKGIAIISPSQFAEFEAKHGA